ncbi:MAG: hypothetical protein J7M25_13915, partial [Deltaproteobacteria bacterium]|nr:hypothetical protein [Deltaproteobacteria bacterium]
GSPRNHRDEGWGTRENPVSCPDRMIPSFKDGSRRCHRQSPAPARAAHVAQNPTSGMETI